MPKILDTEVEAGSCSLCGATRPDAELKNPGCANCANLKLIAESIKNEKANKAKQEAESKKISDEIKFLPDLDKAASSLYDNERGVWWLGINLKQKDAEPVGLILIVDQAKQGMLVCLLDWKRRQEARDRLTLGVKRTVKDNIVSILNKAGQAGDKISSMFNGK